MEDDKMFRRRMAELSEQAWVGSRYCFSDFLNASELSEFYDIEKSGALSPAGYDISGGYEEAERCMIRFGSEEAFGYTEPFPIRCLKIVPLSEKYAEELTHRDFLGALMNLGIERSVVGDLVVRGHSCYVFCEEKIAGFICDGIDQVKHTHMKCTVSEEVPAEASSEKVREEVQVSSDRIDGIVARFTGLSRSEVLELFRTQKVFLNGRCTEENAKSLQAGDVLSVRGFGKLRYLGLQNMTRKGKMNVAYERFV
jgi:RNA-binding protein YlmH